jgi:hypothetical protein
MNFLIVSRLFLDLGGLYVFLCAILAAAFCVWAPRDVDRTYRLLAVSMSTALLSTYAFLTPEWVMTEPAAPWIFSVYGACVLAVGVMCSYLLYVSWRDRKAVTNAPALLHS